MTYDLSSEVKSQKFFFKGMLYGKIYIIGVNKFKYSIDFLFWPLRGYISWPMTSYQMSKLEFHIWHDVSEYIYFCDLIAQILHCFFSEVTSHYLWPLTSNAIYIPSPNEHMFSPGLWSRHKKAWSRFGSGSLEKSRSQSSFSSGSGSSFQEKGISRIFDNIINPILEAKIF